MLQLFADVLRRPGLRPEKLEVAQNQAIADVARQNDDPLTDPVPRVRGDRLRPRLPLRPQPTYASVGADRPRRPAPPGTASTSTRTASSSAWSATSDAPRRWRWCARPSATGRAARRRSGRGAACRERPTPGIYFVEKDDVPQSSVAMGHLGDRARTHPDFYALEVMNQVLSGSFASRLFPNVRTKKGLAYAVYGQRRQRLGPPRHARSSSPPRSRPPAPASTPCSRRRAT